MEPAQLPEDLERCVAFHGHLCPGVVIGYCAAKAALSQLGVDRAEDEELVAIVENDSCAVDAVQVLTGCTFGKGNLIFRDYGKMVFTFFARARGASVRLCLRRLAPPGIDEVPDDRRREHTIAFLLADHPETFFDIREGLPMEAPPAARVHNSLPCDLCDEMVMSTRLRQRDGKKICIPCDEDAQKRKQS